MPFIYTEVKQEVGYTIDLLVHNKVIVEIKSVENFSLSFRSNPGLFKAIESEISTTHKFQFQAIKRQYSQNSQQFINLSLALPCQ